MQFTRAALSVMSVTVAILATASVGPAAASTSDDVSFVITGYDGPDHLTAHLVPNAAARTDMANGKTLVWNFGDGTYCESNPVQGSGYVPDPNSTCSDPAAITHVYPSTPVGFLVQYQISVGFHAPPSQFGYAFGTGAEPGGPFVNTDTGYEYRLYDDQTLNIDLNPFVSRAGAPVNWDVVPTTPYPYLGTATVGTAGILHLVPGRAEHEHQILELAGYHDNPEWMALEFPLVLDIQKHAAPHLHAINCARAPARTRNRHCTIALSDVDRTGSSTYFRTTLISQNKHVLFTATSTVAGGTTIDLSHTLTPGRYQLTSISSDGMELIHTFNLA